MSEVRLIDADALLTEWVDRLFLNAWKIKLRIGCKADEVQNGTWANTEWTEVTKDALISIVDPDTISEKMTPFNLEKTLVHELLHLKFSLLSDLDSTYPSLQDRIVHQLIDEMARAFVDAKRNGGNNEDDSEKNG